MDELINNNAQVSKLGYVNILLHSYAIDSWQK